MDVEYDDRPDEIEADETLGPSWGPEEKRPHFIRRHALALIVLTALALYGYAMAVSLR